ncbi:transfer/carrier protein [Lithospermum erythrorhizon]|uniref:Transfer/carrier protein n=1 Tax=Lithospermum erythrorhizon TaxID=34254 RepID=A0AAV3R9K5_LITER
MMGFHDLIMAALFGLVFACVIAKFVSVGFYESKVKVDANKVVKVVEHVNLGNALKVRRSRSKKRVTFVDDVVVRHVDKLGFEEGGEGICEEIKRVVFSGEEGVIVEGKSEKDWIFKCFDEKNVYGHGKNIIYSDEWNKGMLYEALEREIIGETNDIDIFDQHLSIEEENVIKGSNTENVEILKCVDEQRVNEEGKMFYMLEAGFGLECFNQESDCSVNIDEPFSVNEEKLRIGAMDDLTIEEKVSKEETSTSGSVLEGSVVDEKMNNEGFSSQSSVEFVSKHATLDQKEDYIVERLNEHMEGKLGGRDEEESRVEVLGGNVEGELSKKDNQRVTKNEDVVIDEEDDDWEGIERTELEKVFAEAVNYVEFGLQGKDDHQLAKLGSEVQMQLYGLHKIAVQGSCHQAQPMALNFFARAKWNAWQKLGTMTPEVAMEEYIKLLTKNFPEWVQHFDDMTSILHQEDVGQSSLESGTSHDADHRCSLQDIQPNLLPEQTQIGEK